MTVKSVKGFEGLTTDECLGICHRLHSDISWNGYNTWGASLFSSVRVPTVQVTDSPKDDSTSFCTRMYSRRTPTPGV